MTIDDEQATFAYEAEVDGYVSEDEKPRLYAYYRRQFLSELVDHLEEMRSPVVIDYSFRVEPSRRVYGGEILTWRCRLTAVKYDHVFMPSATPDLSLIAPPRTIRERLRVAAKFVLGR